MAKKVNHFHASPAILSVGLLAVMAFAMVIGISQVMQTQTTNSNAQEMALGAPTPRPTPTPTPTKVPTPSPTPPNGCGLAGCCANLGYGSKCQYTSSSCSGGYVDNYCSGGSNYKCCVGTTTSCYANHNGKCQTVGGTQPCNSPKSYHSSYCPGPSNVKCCY